MRLRIRVAGEYLTQVIHYTLNMGLVVDFPRSDVSREAIEVLQPLVENGGPIPGCAPFRVSVDHGAGSAVFTIWLGIEPIVYCALAWTVEGAAEAWPAIAQLYLNVSNSYPELAAPWKEVAKPASLPWLAVAVLPFILNQTRDDIYWLGDFERCMAWTILEARTAR